MDEGDKCRCGGVMILYPVTDCTCHIAPPCGRCTSNPIVCSTCGLTEEEQKLVPNGTGIRYSGRLKAINCGCVTTKGLMEFSFLVSRSIGPMLLIVNHDGTSVSVYELNFSAKERELVLGLQGKIIYDDNLSPGDRVVANWLLGQLQDQEAKICCGSKTGWEYRGGLVCVITLKS